jgi:hypothetical protein
MIRIVSLAVTLFACTACAVNLGGSTPEEYRAIAIEAPASASAAAVADVIMQANASIALVTAERDSAWFAEISSATGLALSGPGTTESAAKGFFTNLQIVGDTSIALGVADGTKMHLHDALYQIEEGREVDLMLLRIAPATDLREAIRTLLSYVATDVGPNAAVMVAIDTPTAEVGDSVAVLLRALYTSATECAGPDATGPQAESIRLFYGPSARLRCARARTINFEGTPVTADLVVGR